MLDGHCFALDFGDVRRGAFCACPELYVGSRCEQLSGDVLVKHLSLTHTPPLTTTASLVPVTHLKADNTNTTAANTTTTTTIIDININATIATTTTTTTTISLSVVLTWTAWIGGAVCGMLALFLFCFVMKMVRDQLTAITDKPHTLSPTTGPLGPLHIGELAELKTVLVEETTTRVMTSFSTSYCTLSAVMTCHDTVTDSQRQLSSFT
ncbi:uncharacterized protein LOC143292106 [Babylonia areolata]|uniref:uncharacterized protein LOC143292106 n=1 Tax=Babylonia areolata TaxID=304850 RepID=UPI003FD57ADB